MCRKTMLSTHMKGWGYLSGGFVKAPSSITASTGFPDKRDIWSYEQHVMNYNKNMLICNFSKP